MNVFTPALLFSKLGASGAFSTERIGRLVRLVTLVRSCFAQ
jgi:hypothetical protein